MGTALQRPGTTRLAIAVLMLLPVVLSGVLLVATSGAAEALIPASGPAISQCNDQADAGATTTTCDITITNVITYNADGTSMTASTIVKTVNGVALTTTATSPITEVHQCNQAGKGGASTVTCTSTITNQITGAPASDPAESTINQCNPVLGSPTTTCTGTPAGPKATGGYQAIDQCNNSGATGTVTCTATAGVASDSAPRVTIDQCNGSATTGASTLTCTATVTNTFACAGTTVLLANGACFPASGASTSTTGASTSTTGARAATTATTVATTATTATAAVSTSSTVAASRTTVTTGGGTTGATGGTTGATGGTLTSSLNPSQPRESVVFTFTSVGPGSPATGNVTFFDGPTKLGTVLLAGGQATFATAKLTAGNHAITARFSEAGSSSTSRSAALEQTVERGTGLPRTGGRSSLIGFAFGLLLLVTGFALYRTVGPDT